MKPEFGLKIHSPEIPKPVRDRLWFVAVVITAICAIYQMVNHADEIAPSFPGKFSPLKEA